MKNALVQWTGNLTLSKTKSLAEDVKEKIMSPSEEGKVKAIRITVFDSEGNPLVFQGPMRQSKKGNITANFSVQCQNFEIVEIDAEERVVGTTSSIEELQQELLAQSS